MAQTYAHINKETLSFICSQIGVSATYLSQRAKISEKKIGACLNNSSTDLLTINQAKELAKVLKIPFAGLYMNKDIVPVKKLPIFKNLRTLPYEITMDNSSLNLAVAELIRYHDFMTSSESEMDFEAVPLSLPIIPDSASWNYSRNWTRCSLI